MKQVLTQLEKLTYKHQPRQIFDDWTELMITSFTGEQDKYEKTAGRYKEDEITQFAKALAHLLKLMQETNEEQLGDIYEAWQINNKYHGQFFTPKHISKLVAKISLGEGTKGNILDPACGAGSMLIQAAKLQSSKDCDESTYHGTDIDYTCAKMCALNMLFFNLNSVIIWGDTLTMKHWGAWKTYRSHALGGSIRYFDDVPAIQHIQKGVQATLI